MKRISIDELNFDLAYEGYYWYSNKSKPEIADKLTKDIFTLFPFIVEGNFYSQEKEISISIKYIDGEYKVFQACLKDLPANQVTHEEYIAHDLEGVKKIKMIHFWTESGPDPLLEGMTTLFPAWQAFKGFKK